MPAHNFDSTVDAPTSPSDAKRTAPASPPSSPPAMPTHSISPHSAIPPTLRRKDAILIFDWDDTLLCSSFLSSLHCRLDTDLSAHPLHSLLSAQLAELDQCTSALLAAALHYSPHHVHVVTNAETGWVQLSAAKFLPLTFAVLARCKIVSARSNHEALFPDAPLKWKYCAFQQQLSAAGGGGSPSMPRSVISLGDSHVEREAVRAATRGMVGTYCKSVKFSERTDCAQLRRQVELVTRCLAYIVQHDADLDLQLTVQHNDTKQAEADSKQREAQRLAAERAAEKERERLRYASSGEYGSEYDACGDSEMGSERESEHSMAIRTR